MVVAAEKSAGQNSAYRHHIMKGASETERPSLFCRGRTKLSVSKARNRLNFARDAATFCVASPQALAVARRDSHGNGDSKQQSSPAALRHAHASNSLPRRR